MACFLFPQCFIKVIIVNLSPYVYSYVQKPIQDEILHLCWNGRVTVNTNIPKHLVRMKYTFVIIRRDNFPNDIVLKLKLLFLQSSVADPDPFDPDPAFHFDPDPDHVFNLIRIRLFGTDPDPYHFKGIVHQKQYFLYILTWFSLSDGLPGPNQKAYFVKFSLLVNLLCSLE
jgi:hypothetical protein